MTIPKTIHLSWKHKNILESQSPLIVNGMKNLVELNPDWQVTVYDDKDIDDGTRVGVVVNCMGIKLDRGVPGGSLVSSSTTFPLY